MLIKRGFVFSNSYSFICFILTVLYKLATPTIEMIDYADIITYYPYTQIYTTGSEISPDLDVTVRIVR